jgi:gliding motility-associated-like protein
MKRITVILALFLITKTTLAEHITGGEMYYTLDSVSSDGTIFYYHFTLKLYRDCNSSGADLDAAAAVAIFEKGGGMVWNGMVDMNGPKRRLQLSTPGPCITNAPVVCYEVGYYDFYRALPRSVTGYTVAYQRCCRINGINNLIGSGNTGATYVADIPGTSRLSSGPNNNSARFIGLDTVIVCGGYPFTYNFGAVDRDRGDVLRYSFCSAYVGGSSGSQQASAPNPPLPPPYGEVSYNSGYSSSSPLGSSVTINPNTGVITGTAPPQGIYVVTVCVEEIRGGQVIAVQRKDLQIKSGGCDIAKAQLKPDYITCDGLSYTLSNLSNSPLINSYYWDFGDPGSGAANISTAASPTHTFSQAGDYTVELVTNRGQECSDSTTTVVKVWPGFFPNFNSAGICLINPVFFTDATTTNYGVVDSWIWNFGDGTPVSNVQNPSHQYTSVGPKNIQLTVSNSKGCVDTISKIVTIIDKPPITLPFRDTLMCDIDDLQLQASGTGNFSWTPTAGMINPNTATPTVSPDVTTTYYVRLDEQGCINSDSVRVRVVSFVTLNVMPDTTICRTDPVQLLIESDGLRYQWTPAALLDDPTKQDPIAFSGIDQTYTVLAKIGSCEATKSINILTDPYPVANAGADTLICYNTPAQLRGSHDGTEFFWSPINSLLNATTLNPIAYPATSTRYVLTAFDTRPGCPKPGRDTVLVNVLPKIVPYAGNDTMVVVGQPLQLNAEGGVRYSWSPATGLNNTTIKNPIGLYGSEIDSVRYEVAVFNEAGCSDTATVGVIVFKTNPYVFVPTGFTPNGDGRNDLVKPIAVGVQKIHYFRVYNRWGQLVFSTTTNGHGWDGTIGGQPQASNVFVWMVSATDYLGKPIFLKGTVTLIR